MCASCGSPRCPAHLSPQSGFTQCLACANQEATTTDETDDYDDDWSYRYRSSYYTDSGYHPMRSYDSSDRSGFDTGDEALMDDDREGAGFGDS
jgi:hypothetical protein